MVKLQDAVSSTRILNTASNYFCAVDNDVLQRHVLMAGDVSGFDFLDFVHHFGSFHHSAEHTITVTLRSGRGEIQESVVSDVDEKLAGSGMGFRGASHGYGIGFVFKAVVRLVLNLRKCCFLLHPGLESAALYHEAVNHAMK